MIQFVPRLPNHIYVAQTKINDLQPIDTTHKSLQGLNLALHVQDDSRRVHLHRMQLLQFLTQYDVRRLTWCHQIHSTICHRVHHQCQFDSLVGDALVTAERKHALMMMTADCLAIVLGDDQATEVANLHAGWRGLAQGVIEQTLAKMNQKATWAWLSSAISQDYFEVGEDVKMAFIQHYGHHVCSYFKLANQPHKYFADLYAIARYILQQNGITQILGGEECTYRQYHDYYSYRRDSQSGRMATFVFLGSEK